MIQDEVKLLLNVSRDTCLGIPLQTDSNLGQVILYDTPGFRVDVHDFGNLPTSKFQVLEGFESVNEEPERKAEPMFLIVSSTLLLSLGLRRSAHNLFWFQKN